MANKVRHLVFTINNPKDEPQELLQKFEEFARYVIFQKEAGKKGTPHYQGYVEFYKPKRYVWCSKNIAPGWWKKREGTREQARAYCQKGDTRLDGPWEAGQFLDSGQGKRTDIDRLVELAEQGLSTHEIARQEPRAAIRYPRGLQLIVEAHAPKRSGAVEVHLIHDEPGKGKSTFLAEKYGSEAYWKSPGKWWDGYSGQPVIVLDEYRGWLTITDLLYALRPIGFKQMQTKGSHVFLAHTQVWITTNYHPSTWHDYTTKSCEKGYEAIQERVDHVYVMENWFPVEINKVVYF